MKRNFPDKIINGTIEKWKKLDRKDLLNSIQKKSIITLVTTYKPRNPNVTPTCTVKHLN